MAARERSGRDDPPEQSYFAAAKKHEFIPSGCRMLDCVLGGGWPLGRISNVVGDKATGKTLLAIEACANFANKYPKGRIFYREVEAAFDSSYAEALGMPIKRVEFDPLIRAKVGAAGKRTGDTLDKIDTVEDLFADMDEALSLVEAKKLPALYIVDSLDALTTEVDNAREFGEQTYRTDKPAMLGELFRKKVRPIETSRMHLMVISQVRDKIGAMFGAKWTRSGGKALDFYASHVLLLAHIARLTKTVGKTTRATGVRVRAKCEKNKIGLPFRECEFIMRFGYGIDDITASVEWLESVNKLKTVTDKAKGAAYLDWTDDLDDDSFKAETQRVCDIAERIWRDIDQGLLPTRRKYG